MLFQALPNSGSVKSISSIDSLKQSMHFMQVKMDSLERVVLKTEIGTNFFSDVISQNLYTYAIIISLLALISWGTIWTTMFFDRKSINENTEKAIKVHSEKFDLSLNDVKYKLLQTIYDANRGMYFVALSNGSETRKFEWALYSASAYLDTNSNSTKTLIIWLESAIGHLPLVPIRDKSLKENTQIHFKHLDKIDCHEDQMVVSLSKKIREEILSICHSKLSKAPDNLLAGNVTNTL